MSRFGKLSVSIPAGVSVSAQDRRVIVTGPKGTLEKTMPSDISVKVSEEGATVEKNRSTKIAQALQGTFRSHILNMVHGVNEGWSKTLEISGAGYRGEVQGKKLVLSVGFSHPVNIEAPEGIEFKMEKSVITVSGIDKELVGHMSALIRRVRPPEPYKGAGIKYSDEVIRRKAGKQAAKGA